MSATITSTKTTATKGTTAPKATTPKGTSKAAKGTKAAKADRSPEAVEVAAVEAQAKAQAEAKAETDRKEKEAAEYIAGLVTDVREKWENVEGAGRGLRVAQVLMARSVGRLGTAAGMTSKRGKTAGKMAITKIAEALEWSATGITPYVKAAQDLDAIGRLHLENGAEVTDEDIAVLDVYMDKEAARKAKERAAKAKAETPAAGGDSENEPVDGGMVEVNVPSRSTLGDIHAALGDIHAALEQAQAAVDNFTKDSGFTQGQADTIEDMLAGIASAVAEGTSTK